MKTKIIATISALFLLIVGVIIVSSLTRGNNQGRNWEIELAIYSVASSSGTYFIQIGENNVIRTRFGTRRNRDFTVATLHEKLISEVRNEDESVLSDSEMLTVLSLAQELEAVGVIDEVGNAEGTWEVVLTYNGVRYAMDYNVASVAVSMGETRHENAYPIYHYEVFLRLINEIIRLSPIERF